MFFDYYSPFNLMGISFPKNSSKKFARSAYDRIPEPVQCNPGTRAAKRQQQREADRKHPIQYGSSREVENEEEE